MTGQYEVAVRNRRLQYKFMITRNLTILRGDSATGKTTLIEMIQAYQQDGADSGVSVACARPCVVLSGRNWQLLLSAINDSIVFIDEGNAFVASQDFAEVVRTSTNYYVIATRTSLFNLPYSIMEVYGIRNTAGNKYQGTKRLYSELYHLYGDSVSASVQVQPDLVIVEDAKAGYEFFKQVCARFDIPCVSACGKSNVYKTVLESDAAHVLIVADDAAFGPEIERLLSLRYAKSIGLYMPESFEWLLLKADVLKDSSVMDILSHPADFIESSHYFSWEAFFTALLTEKSKGTYLAYTKARLNPAYMQEKEMQKVLSVMPTNFPAL